jgi:hypothetical protein
MQLPPSNYGTYHYATSTIKLRKIPLCNFHHQITEHTVMQLPPSNYGKYHYATSTIKLRNIPLCNFHHQITEHTVMQLPPFSFKLCSQTASTNTLPLQNFYECQIIHCPPDVVLKLVKTVKMT